MTTITNSVMPMYTPHDTSGGTFYTLRDDSNRWLLLQIDRIHVVKVITKQAGAYITVTTFIDGQEWRTHEYRKATRPRYNGFEASVRDEAEARLHAISFVTNNVSYAMHTGSDICLQRLPDTISRAIARARDAGEVAA